MSYLSTFMIKLIKMLENLMTIKEDVKLDAEKMTSPKGHITEALACQLCIKSCQWL